MKLMKKLWGDEHGFIVSAELVLIATILVVGLLVGLVTIRDQVVQELADVADAMSEVDQSYVFNGITGHASSTAGTVFNDEGDYCDTAGGNNGDQQTGGAGEPNCIDIEGVAPPLAGGEED